MNKIEVSNGVIYNEDCMNVLKQMPDESINLIATDPPYPVMSRGSAGNAGGMLQKDVNKKGRVFTFNDIDCEEYATEFYRVLKDGSHCYVMTNHINLIHMLNTFTDLRTPEEYLPIAKARIEYPLTCVLHNDKKEIKLKEQSTTEQNREVNLW